MLFYGTVCGLRFFLNQVDLILLFWCDFLSNVIKSPWYAHMMNLFIWFITIFFHSYEKNVVMGLILRKVLKSDGDNRNKKVSTTCFSVSNTIGGESAQKEKVFFFLQFNRSAFRSFFASLFFLTFCRSIDEMSFSLSFSQYFLSLCPFLPVLLTGRKSFASNTFFPNALLH